MEQLRAPPVEAEVVHSERLRSDNIDASSREAEPKHSAHFDHSGEMPFVQESGGTSKYENLDVERSKIHGEKILCEDGADPFAEQSVEFFVPPRAASFQLRNACKTLISGMLHEVSRIEVGGQQLRDIMNEKVAEMKVKRYEMFCRFVCGDKCSI